MAGVNIRLAKPEDIAAVQELSFALFEDLTSASDKHSDHNWAKDERGKKAFTDQITKPDEALWVAEESGKIVAFLSAGQAAPLEWRPIKRVELYSFYVMPDYRSQGVGRQLCEKFFAWAREQNATTAMVAAYADNARAIEFYKRVGFAPETLQLEIEL